MENKKDRWFLVPVELYVEVLAEDAEHAMDRAMNFLDTQAYGGAGDGIGWRMVNPGPAVGAPVLDEDALDAEDEAGV